MTEWLNRCHFGDCIETMRRMPDGIVQTCVTSPPYFALRSYLDDGHDDKSMEIGTEATPDAYVAKLVEVFREVRRVMRDDGTLWLNLGDSYGTIGGNTHGGSASGLCRDGRPEESRAKTAAASGARMAAQFPRAPIETGLRPKNLLGIPWRVAFALQADGWYLRSEIIWAKPNPMPESVTDRPTKAHEQIFLLSKSATYFYDHEAVKEPLSEVSLSQIETFRRNGVRAETLGGLDRSRNDTGGLLDRKGGGARGAAMADSTGRNKRSVWTVASEPYSGAHFACVDEATDCLTAIGWRRHNELQPGMLAAQFDMSTGMASWGAVAEVARYDVRDQEMVRARTRDLDMLLTPNHRCVIHRRDKETRLYRDPVVVRADQMLPSHGVPTSAAWAEQGDASLSLEWAELLGWYIAEGHESKQTTSVEIYQSLSANPQHVARIEELLRQVGAEWTAARYERTWRGAPTIQIAFRVMGFAAYRLREMSPSKAIPAGALMWSADRINALLRGLVDGDGHTRPDGRLQFVQKDAGRAAAVQALAFRAGLSATLSVRSSDGIHSVYITKHRFRSFRGTAGIGVPTQREQYSGVVWCPRTPHGTWVARRNGRIFVTGNTFPRKLIEPCILAGAPVGGVVLDPFLGSGTCAQVAQDLGRQWIGCELNRAYEQMQRERVAQTSFLLEAAA